MLLSQAQLARARAILTRSLTDPCTIVRNGILVATTICRITDDKGMIRVLGGQRYDGLRRFKVILPWDANVQYADQIFALGGVYAATIVQDPISLATCTLIQSYQLYDKNGIPTYLKPNAVISTIRQVGGAFVNPLDHEPNVRVDLPKTEIATPNGPDGIGHLYTVPGLDINRDDKLIIHELTGFGNTDPQDLGDMRLQGVRPEGGALPMLICEWKGRET